MQLRSWAILATLQLALCGHARAGWGVAWTFGGSGGIVTNGSAYNNPDAQSGTQAAFIQATAYAEQSFQAATPGRYAIGWQASVRWVDPNHDYDVMVDGTARLRVNSATLNPYKYTPLSLAVDLAAGNHVLRFQGVNSRGGDHTSFVDTVTIAAPTRAGVLKAKAVPLGNAGFDDPDYKDGTYVVRPPAVTSAAARINAAKVTTSGRCIYAELVSLIDATYMPILSVDTMPVVWRNGVEVGPCTRAVFTPDHHGFMLFLPDSIAVETGDTVSLSAPMAWASVANDFAEALDRSPVAIHAGRSWVTTDTFKPTLKIGMNFGHQQVPTYGTYGITRDMRVRGTSWEVGVTGWDANGFPAKLDRDTVATTILYDTNSSVIDETGTPTPEGLYAVGWGRNAPSEVECSLASDNATVTERSDLSTAGGADGRGFVRVFDFKRNPGTTRTNFRVSLKITDKQRAPSWQYLVVYGPGDFEAKQPVVLEGIGDPSYPSAMFMRRTAGGIGGMRFADGVIGYDNADNACEPEHMMPETRCQWNGWYRADQIKFKQARPWTNANSPYYYSPLGNGEQFPATLGSSLDAPAAGTRQVVQVPDAETAPVFEGLVLQSGGERMRVLSVDGQSVTIERGSESTIPQARGAGPIVVAGRFPLPDLSAFGVSNMQVMELVATTRHKYRSGNHAHLDGGGWAPWPMADGSKSNNNNWLQYYTQGTLVTAADRLVIMTKGPNKPNTTLAGPVDLAPDIHWTWLTVPGSPHLPYSVQARVAARANSDLHVNIPYAASNSYVDALAKILLANYPPGRRVYVEYLNEPWNWAYPTWQTQATWCYLQDRGPEGSMTWIIRRGGQVTQRIQAAFDAVGRGAEVRGVFNMQQGRSDLVRTAALQCRAEGLPVPDMAIAPYTEISMQPSLVRGFEAGGIDRAVDLWTYHVGFGTNPNVSGSMAYCQANRKAVDAVNAEFGLHVESYGYEGGTDTAWPIVVANLAADVAATATSISCGDASLFVPGQHLKVDAEWIKVSSISGNTLTVQRGMSGTQAAAHAKGAQVRNAYMESARDLTYHPLFRIAEHSQYALWQRYFDRLLPNGYSVGWPSGNKAWGYSHWFNQMPGRGDGKDGLADNRLFMATPGYPTTKPPGVSQDLNSVSVRQRAFVEWNWMASQR